MTFFFFVIFVLLHVNDNFPLLVQHNALSLTSGATAHFLPVFFFFFIMMIQGNEIEATKYICGGRGKQNTTIKKRTSLGEDVPSCADYEEVVKKKKEQTLF